MILARFEVTSCARVHFAALRLLDCAGHMLENVLLNCVAMINYAATVLPHATPVTHLDQVHRYCSH